LIDWPLDNRRETQETKPVSPSELYTDRTKNNWKAFGSWKLIKISREQTFNFILSGERGGEGGVEMERVNSLQVDHNWQERWKFLLTASIFRWIVRDGYDRLIRDGLWEADIGRP